MSLLRLLPAFALVGFASAAAAQDAPSVDLVALAFVGFAEGAQVSIGQEPTTVRQTGPGAFEGTTGGVVDMKLDVVESTPCLFDLSLTNGDQTLRVRLDLGLVQAIAYSPGGSMGLPEPILPYAIELTGAEGMAVRPLDDGTTEPLDNSPNLATSATIDQLQAAAAALQAACPSR